MCMQCVAQSTPMVATGLVVLRRRSLTSFVKASLPAGWSRTPSRGNAVTDTPATAVPAPTA